MVDFFIQVIFTLIKTVRGLWKSYVESKTVAGFISIVMAFVIEKDEQLGRWLLVEMLVGGFQVSEDPLEKLSEALSNYGIRSLILRLTWSSTLRSTISASVSPALATVSCR